jgi:hypothetical protein
MAEPLADGGEAHAGVDEGDILPCQDPASHAQNRFLRPATERALEAAERLVIGNAPEACIMSTALQMLRRNALNTGARGWHDGDGLFAAANAASARAR